MPLWFLFQYNLNGGLKPSTLTCEIEKESSNFFSVTIKIYMLCISIGFCTVAICNKCHIL